MHVRTLGHLRGPTPAAAASVLAFNRPTFARAPRQAMMREYVTSRLSSGSVYFRDPFSTPKASSASHPVPPRSSRHSGSITGMSQLSSILMSRSANPSAVVAPSLTEQGEEVELLTAINDDHGGVIIEIKAPMNTGVFVSSLRASLSNWRQQGIKGVWIKLPIELAHLVQAAVQEGFWYHHAEPSYLMLVQWLPATEHTIPINASHRVSIGAFVMNDKREVLAVQEKCGKYRGLGVWKFPTGVVDQGEDISAGAMREVKEETDIDTEFVEVLAFRQSHMAFFGKSDLFFMCMLRPLSFDIQKQESEIEAAQWMPIEEFAAQPFSQQHESVKYAIDVGLAKFEKHYAGFTPVCVTSSLSDELSYLYLNGKDLNQPSASAKGSKNC